MLKRKEKKNAVLELFFFYSFPPLSFLLPSTPLFLFFIFLAWYDGQRSIPVINLENNLNHQPYPVSLSLQGAEENSTGD